MSDDKIGATKRVRLYEFKEWEEFITEWATFKYQKPVPQGGSGDMGRDISCYENDECTGEYDILQCKAYNKQLKLGDILKEVAKVCYYTHQGEYQLPRKYYFVCPFDATTSVSILLTEKQSDIKVKIINEWNKKFSKNIIEKKEILLTEELKKHINGIDFKIFSFVPIATVIRDFYDRPSYWKIRFDLSPPERPDAKKPPEDVKELEKKYTSQLLAVYSKDCGKSMLEANQLPPKGRYRTHFSRCRTDYYSAESLRTFSCEKYDEKDFNAIKKDIHSTVSDMPCSESPLTRINEILTKAAEVTPNSKLTKDMHVYAEDKKGVCHHLVEDGQLYWNKEEEDGDL